MIRYIHLIILIFLLAACSSGTSDPIYTRISDASLNARDPIPPPDGEIILTVTGRIGTTNDDERIVMDVTTLESVGLVEYAVTDPFKEEQVVYRGVLMSDLLAVWQVPEDATTLDMLALNDYHVEVPISDLRQYPVMFALQADGEYMQVDDRGPAMLVYPYDDYEFARPLYDAYWIWQIESIDVR